ncbi:MAG: hypothetical protein AABZ13_06275 [Planctomycetota bacterium]
MKRFLFLGVLSVVFSCGDVLSASDTSAKKVYTEIEVREGGSIVGNITFADGAAITELNLHGGWDLGDSTKSPSEKVVISKINGGLKSVVVSLTDISAGKKKVNPEIHPVIDQQKNNFIPRVTAILTGTLVDILNGDQELHTVHTKTTRNQPFNHGANYKMRITKTFEYPETIKLTCDIHKKSYAWIVVLDNPYFDVTDRNGYFEICDIPPGAYKLQVWHEELGNLEKEVTIHPKEITKVELVYS